MRIETVYQQILQLDAAGRHDEALSQARLLERLARARFGQNHASYAYALGVEAWMLDADGQIEAADDLYQRALTLFGKTEGAKSEHIPQFLMRLGKMYRRVGRLPAAEQAFRLTVAIYEKHKRGDPVIADALLELAIALESQGRLREAEPIILRAEDIAKKAYGSESAQATDALIELAIIREQQGRFADAEEIHLDLLKVLEKGGSASRLTMELGNLAALYAEQDRFAEAEALLRRALAMTKATPDPADPREIIVNLANVLAAQGRLDEAARLQETMLHADEQALGADHPTVLAESHNLASTYQDLGRLDEAAAIFRRVIASKEERFGRTDPSLSRTLEGLANVLSRQGNYDEAVSLIERAIAINEKALGPAPPAAPGTRAAAAPAPAPGRRPAAAPRPRPPLCLPPPAPPRLPPPRCAFPSPLASPLSPPPPSPRSRPGVSPAAASPPRYRQQPLQSRDLSKGQRPPRGGRGRIPACPFHSQAVAAANQHGARRHVQQSRQPLCKPGPMGGSSRPVPRSRQGAGRARAARRIGAAEPRRRTAAPTSLEPGPRGVPRSRIEPRAVRCPG